MAPDGSGIVELLDGSWECHHPRWSPDGMRIAFTSGQDGTLDIYIVDVNSGDVRRVTERPGDNVMPAWVGNEALLFSGETGDRSWDLFLVELDQLTLVQLTNTPESERYPAWAP